MTSFQPTNSSRGDFGAPRCLCNAHMSGALAAAVLVPDTIPCVVSQNIQTRPYTSALRALHHFCPFSTIFAAFQQ